MNGYKSNACQKLEGYADGRPFCFYSAPVGSPQSEWLWEECDIPVCGKDCSSPGHINQSLPACQQIQEDNPSLQAAVALLTGGGVGIGDSIDNINHTLVMSTCRADGKLLQLSTPVSATPLQLQRMVGDCPNYVPYSCAGEIWSGRSDIPDLGGETSHMFNVVLVADNADGEEEDVDLRLLDVDPTVGDCLVFYTKNLVVVELVCGDSGVTVPGSDFTVLYASPVHNITDGARLALLGELDKLAVISRDRVRGLVREGSFYRLELEGGVGEVVFITWMVW